jgi:glycogen debranching enzyme
MTTERTDTEPNATSRPDWLPTGEEIMPTGSITHLAIIRHDGVSALSLPQGDIDARTEPSSGVYFRDTRYLSRLSVSFGGVAPVPLDARQVEPGLSAIFTNPALQSPHGGVIESQTLVLRRRRVVSEGLVESFDISSYGQQNCEVELRIDFDADFEDIFAVRGFPRQTPAPAVDTAVEGDNVTYTYTGNDAVTRTSHIHFHTAPSTLTARRATFIVPLQPRETRTIELELHIECEAHGLNPCSFNSNWQQKGHRSLIAAASAHVEEDHRNWLDTLTRVETNDDTVTALMERSLLDIAALRTTIEDQDYLAAGVPWFDTLFGRDSLIAGMQLAAFAPQALRSALLLLARHQATEHDPVHDASPGKIPHELRWGELAGSGEVPFGRYYGSVDSTPLFIMAAHEYIRWTNDDATLQLLWPALRNARRWCLEHMVNGPRGFLAYHRESESGLENQGWKDSHDCIVWPDGPFVRGPIALVEVQGYVAAALRAYGRLEAFMDHPGAWESRQESDRFRTQIDAAFGHPELGYVLCLDGEGRPVPTPSSNAGHLLWAGAASPKLARITAQRLLEPDLFTGWGIRTLSEAVTGFNPLGYHTGSVWPHDTSLIVGGLRAYAIDEEAQKLGSALLEAALAFPEYRLPELFSGDARDLRKVPTPYPVASRPQAWAAAAIPYVFASMLGLRPGGPNQIRVIRPDLPRGVDWLRLTNLRVGEGSVDVTFRRTASRISVEVEDIRGSAEVVLGST